MYKVKNMFNDIRRAIKSHIEKRKNKVYRQNAMVKEVLFFSMCVLLLFAGVRAYSLYNFYNHSTRQDKQLDQTIDEGVNVILKEFLLSSYRNAYFHNRTDAYNLQTNLIENHGVDKVYDNLVNGEYSAEVYETFMDTFADVYKADKDDRDSAVFVANDDGIIFSKSNNKQDKFTSLKKDKKTISWTEFFNSMENPEVTKKAFMDSYFKSYTTEPIVVRLDEEYENNKYYSIDDLCEIYSKEGLEGLDGFGFLVTSTITEKGDMYGNVDNTFMQNNNVHKLFVYHYVDVTTFLKDHERALNELDTNAVSMLENMQLERKVSIMISVVSLLLILLVVICLMIIYRELSNKEMICEDETDIDKKRDEENVK